MIVAETMFRKLCSVFEFECDILFSRVLFWGVVETGIIVCG